MECWTVHVFQENLASNRLHVILAYSWSDLTILRLKQSWRSYVRAREVKARRRSASHLRPFNLSSMVRWVLGIHQHEGLDEATAGERIRNCEERCRTGLEKWNKQNDRRYELECKAKDIIFCSRAGKGVEVQNQTSTVHTLYIFILPAYKII